MVCHKMSHTCDRLTDALMDALDFDIRVIPGNIQIIEAYALCSVIDYLCDGDLFM